MVSRMLQNCLALNITTIDLLSEDCLYTVGIFFDFGGGGNRGQRLKEQHHQTFLSGTYTKQKGLEVTSNTLDCAIKYTEWW
jgi:hypothetical protein